MSRTWLICDMGYLSYRAFHVFGGLSHGAAGTGVVYGVLKDIQSLMEQHATRHAAFCFDHGRGLRYDVFPDYKKKRNDGKKELTEQEVQAYADMKAQVKKLKLDFLPRLGFKNVFYQKGYEADDLVARCVEAMPAKDDAVIVSADKDLYQLLGDRVVLWNPTTKVCFTDEMFRAKYGVVPAQWGRVKALAGCDTDGVPGLKGVGEATAAAFLRGDAAARCRGKYPVCEAFVKSDQYLTNEHLVTLPFPGTKKVTLQEDEVSPREWKKLTDELGMRSLRDAAPGARGGFGFKPGKHTNG